MKIVLVVLMLTLIFCSCDTGNKEFVQKDMTAEVIRLMEDDPDRIKVDNKELYDIAQGLVDQLYECNHELNDYKSMYVSLRDSIKKQDTVMFFLVGGDTLYHKVFRKIKPVVAFVPHELSLWNKIRGDENVFYIKYRMIAMLPDTLHIIFFDDESKSRIRAEHYTATAGWDK